MVVNPNWVKRQVQLASEFRLSMEDIHNLYDLFYMITTPQEIGINLKETLKLNKMDKWFDKLFNKLDKICMDEKEAGK